MKSSLNTIISLTGTGIGLGAPVMLTINTINSLNSPAEKKIKLENLNKPQSPSPLTIKPSVKKSLPEENKTKSIQNANEENSVQKRPEEQQNQDLKELQKPEERETQEKQSPEPAKKRENKPKSKLQFKYGWDWFLGSGSKK